jgi:hypothetical protein
MLPYLCNSTEHIISDREGYMQKRLQLQFPSTLGIDFSGFVKEFGEVISAISKEIKYMDRLQ